MEITLGPISAIPPGEGRTFKVGNEQIAVFVTRQGCVYATQASCPHRDGPLADGLVGGTTVICPLHGRKFDVSTGECASGEQGLKTYPVRLSKTEQIVVQVERV